MRRRGHFHEDFGHVDKLGFCPMCKSTIGRGGRGGRASCKKESSCHTPSSFSVHVISK